MKEIRCDFLHRQEGKKYLMPDFLSLKSKKIWGIGLKNLKKQNGFAILFILMQFYMGAKHENREKIVGCTDCIQCICCLLFCLDI